VLTRSTFPLVVAILLGSVPLVLAQGGRGPGQGGGWRRGAPDDRMYDPQTVEDVAGEVTKVERIARPRRLSRGVHLVVRTDKGETLPVHLGPEWFIDKQEVTFAVGDKIAVRGSRIDFEGARAIIAAEVTKDGKTLRLRAANGVPAWAGWRGGRGR
jgi:hypothetical protein